MCSTAQEAPPPLEQLEQEICELAAHLAAATCRWLLLLAEFDARAGWAKSGILSCAHWLSWRCSIGMGTAREHLRVAHRLRELPTVREAFAAGTLSYCKVRALTRVATPETEEELVTIARHATGAQLEKLLRAYRRALGATLGTAEWAHEHRYLRWGWNDDGSLRVEGRLTGDDGALLLQALNAAEASAGESRDDAGARRADALVSMARSSLAEGESPRASGDPVEVVVHVDVETLGGDEVRECSEIDRGPAIAPETARRLGCDAAVVRIIERDGRPLSVGRRTRTIPPALRRALRRRDDGCRFPGCTHRRFVHAHHIHHWARGGETALDNLVQLCSYHHRLVHEGGFCVERSGQRGLRFRRPDGHVLDEAPMCPAGRGDPIEERNRTVGVEVDADTCKPLSGGERLDYDHAVLVMCAAARAHGPPGWPSA